MDVVILVFFTVPSLHIMHVQYTWILLQLLQFRVQYPTAFIGFSSRRVGDWVKEDFILFLQNLLYYRTLKSGVGSKC